MFTGLKLFTYTIASTCMATKNAGHRSLLHLAAALKLALPVRSNLCLHLQLQLHWPPSARLRYSAGVGETAQRVLHVCYLQAKDRESQAGGVFIASPEQQPPDTTQQQAAQLETSTDSEELAPTPPEIESVHQLPQSRGNEAAAVAAEQLWQQAVDPATGCFYYYCESRQVSHSAT